MGMTTEWIFTKNGRKTEAQRTRMSFTDEEPSEEGQQALEELADYLVNWYLESKAKEKN